MHIKPHYQADYDVIVLGLGAAGASAARFAADHDKKVLLVDAAPYGHEGGNTRYAGQIVGYTDDYDKMMNYYQEMTKPMHLPYMMMRTYVQGFKDMKDYFKKYLCDPVTYKSVRKEFPNVASMSPEYPEFKDSHSYDFLMVHKGFFDAALLKLLEKKVLDRSNRIDVWLNSRAIHVVQNDDEKVVGVQIMRNHQRVYVHARLGVVLAVGGFENNPEMVQNYLGASHVVPVGGMYNKGDGVKIAEEAGAKLWHMWNYEPLGFSWGAGLTFAEPKGKRSRLVLAWPEAITGSVITVGDDGTRYFNENEPNRHGHLYGHGMWRIPIVCDHPYLVFDQTKYQEIEKGQKPISDLDKRIIKADSLSDLAAKINVPAEKLENTVKLFNQFAKDGRDYQFGRDAKTMRAFDDGPYYAIALETGMLNTQGGPERDEYARIINTDGQPIPHLFGAGELGGINANQYQGGNNLAECLIWGKIAGDQAAVQHPDEASDVSTEMNGINDLMNGHLTHIELGPDEYLGSSDQGMGGRITTRVTYKDGQIKKVEIVENHESEDVAKNALAEMPERIEKANSTDVDVVSGASVTSRAIEGAVKDALKKAK